MEPLLHIDRLSVGFDTEFGLSRAVTDVSLKVYPGETLGLVGESGCGKTVTALSVLGLVPSPPSRVLGGRILWRGEDLIAAPERRLRAVRGAEIAMVFQDPMTSLSPLCRIGDQLVETILLHRKMPRREALALADEGLRRVGLPDVERVLRDYPHQLSGGMQQRVMIASALLLEPALVIADEPTTALDASLQAQALDLMKSAKGRDTALLLITHDMGAVRRVADRVAVMYAGEIVETGPVADIFASPRHPYTAALLAARPGGVPRGTPLYSIPGNVPSPLALPPGCRFAPRCRFAGPACAEAHPDLDPVPGLPGSATRCPIPFRWSDPA